VSASVSSLVAAPGAAEPQRRLFLDQYQQIRLHSEGICEPLETEDSAIQTMPDDR
jgi:hypothetical protein